MYMSDYVDHLDRILSAQGEDVLDGAGRISHQQAVDKALEEYRKYQDKTLSRVERDYLNSIRELEIEAKGESQKR